ncbi:MAG: adenylate kinase [Spirochaetales bacterium]|jgi:adenylate kinase|nr:adenylate kinase [Spirochaetales bacterium]
MKLVLFGPPGAGKGTIAGNIAERRNIPHISTGELFRKAIKNETPLGNKIKSIIDSGALVPDEITIDLVRERLSHDDVKAGSILDGFPRTVPQAEALARFHSIDCVINLQVDDNILLSRLTGRRVCSKCGHGFHINFLPPKVNGICDVCGSELIQREDDMEQAITKRLKVYKTQTEPLIAYYLQRDLITNIDGAPLPETVLESVEEVLSAGL